MCLARMVGYAEALQIRGITHKRRVTVGRLYVIYLISRHYLTLVLAVYAERVLAEVCGADLPPVTAVEKARISTVLPAPALIIAIVPYQD
jgi:hypothetical protein